MGINIRSVCRIKNNSKGSKQLTIIYRVFSENSGVFTLDFYYNPIFPANVNNIVVFPQLDIEGGKEQYYGHTYTIPENNDYFEASTAFYFSDDGDLKFKDKTCDTFYYSKLPNSSCKVPPPHTMMEQSPRRSMCSKSSNVVVYQPTATNTNPVNNVIASVGNFTNPTVLSSYFVRGHPMTYSLHNLNLAMQNSKAKPYGIQHLAGCKFEAETGNDIPGLNCSG
jgi:hypothetical protein